MVIQESSKLIKDAIIGLWKKVNRPGINDLILFLKEESDFFEAPCSIKYHLAEPGGLALHSLNVYDLLSLKIKQYELNTPEDTAIICGLGHDLCKVNYYKKGGDPCNDAQYSYLCSLLVQKQGLVLKKIDFEMLDERGLFKRSTPAASASLLIDWLKNRPQDPFPELPIVYSVNDELPLGHGEKSVIILQDFIKLTEEEKLAIRWHMGAWDLSDYSGRYSFNTAKEMTPLVALLSSADYEASNILEREDEN